MRRLLVLTAAAWLTWPQHAGAETIPPRGSVDPRVRVVAYDPDDVIKLRGHVGYQIHIEWAPGESFVSLGAGDAGGFDIGTERNHFFIKPKQDRLSTNLTVLTTHRTYHFEYTVARAPARPVSDPSVVYSIRFVYPQDQAQATIAQAARRKLETRWSQPAARGRNLDYWYCGAPSLKPVSASDDGVQTRLRFSAHAEFPAIFVRNDDDSESLLNFHIEQDEVIVHRVVRRLILRRGQLVGCIVNRDFNGGSQRLLSNTVSPDIYRDTRGANP